MTRSRTILPFFVLGLAVFATRLPFLFDGYGADTDAWRVIWTGREIAHTGTYVPSRAPGNPIPELVAAALSGSPVWLPNGITALFSAVGVVLFGQLLRRLGCRSWVAGALAFALTPIVWVHSTDAMDYLWALTFVLGAWRLAIDRRWVLSGVLVGLATGCRITSSCMLVPLTIVAFECPSPRARIDGIARLWLAGGAVAALVLSPVIAVCGLQFLHGYEHGSLALRYAVKNLTVDVWGVLGVFALAMASAWAAWRRIPAERSELPAASRYLLLAAAIAILLEAALFFRLPYEAAYLIPAVPFTLLLLARGLARRAFVTLCVCLCLSAAVLKVSEPGRFPPAGGTLKPGVVRLGSRVLQVDYLRGPLLAEQQRRKADLEYARRVRVRVGHLEGPAVIAAQEWLPYLRVLAGASREGEVEYVYTLDPPALDSLRRARIPLYDLPGAEAYTQAWRGYSLRDAGSRPLDVP